MKNFTQTAKEKIIAYKDANFPSQAKFANSVGLRDSDLTRMLKQEKFSEPEYQILSKILEVPLETLSDYKKCRKLILKYKKNNDISQSDFCRKACHNEEEATRFGKKLSRFLNPPQLTAQQENKLAECLKVPVETLFIDIDKPETKKEPAQQPADQPKSDDNKKLGQCKFCHLFEKGYVVEPSPFEEIYEFVPRNGWKMLTSRTLKSYIFKPKKNQNER